MIELVAFDVDGTLRDRDYVPDSTRIALKRLQNKGIELVLCTGRSEFEIADLRKELQMDWAITCNGSHISYRGQTKFATSFDRSTIEQWLNIGLQRQQGIVLYGAKNMYMNKREDTFFRRAQQEIGFKEPYFISPDMYNGLPDIYQCIIFCNEDEQTLYTGHQHEYYLHRWRPWAIDINPGRTNKAIGLRKLLHHLQVSTDYIAAFGDGINDIEMLEMARSGIAMGNAEEITKQKARYVTKSMHEDGIEYGVNRWILGD